MKRGYLVVIEGIDGSGKTTQVELLKQYLALQIVSFPRYEDNVYGKLISRYLIGEFGDLAEVDPYLISLAYAGDRFLAKAVMENWLDQGELVIINRYVASSKAHLAANLPVEKRAQFINWLDELEYQTNGLPKEDLTILLSVDPKVAQGNVAGGHPDLHEDSFKHLEKASNIYLDLAKKESNWYVVDCMKDNSMKSPAEINQVISDIIAKLP